MGLGEGKQGLSDAVLISPDSFLLFGVVSGGDYGMDFLVRLVVVPNGSGGFGGLFCW